MPLLKRQKGKENDELQELLKRAKPLPNIFKPDWLDELDDALVGWVALNAEKWKPRRNPAAIEGRPLPKSIEIDGAPYAGLIIMDDGRVFLADNITYDIMALADGTRTLNEILAKIAVDIARVDEVIRRALEENDEKELLGLYSGFYVAAAMLKGRGLLI